MQIVGINGRIRVPAAVMAVIFGFGQWAAGQNTVLVSKSSAGVQANGGSIFASLSGDGRYVAFVTDSTNLITGGPPTGGPSHVYVYDRVLSQIALVSRDSADVMADASSEHPRLSGNGGFIIFVSAATNLVAGDTDGYKDIFVRNLSTNQTTRVSVDSAGNQGNADSEFPSISADGRYVTFDSWADNLVPNDTNTVRDVFVHDRVSGVTERVSVDSAGVEGNSFSVYSSISADGRYVAFQSDSSLVWSDSNGSYDIYVHDRQTHETVRASLDSDEQESPAGSVYPSISGDGRFVAFYCLGALVTGDTNNFTDVYVRDMQLGQTVRVSVSTAGVEGDADSGDVFSIAISSDGLYVTFASLATNLVPNDTNATPQYFDGRDIFVHDLTTHATTRVSVDSAGRQGNGASSYPCISADGQFIAFHSAASNLVENDTNLGYDVFVNSLDFDGDGLRDKWETDGIPVDADPAHNLILPGANPNHKNLYLEIDAMSTLAPDVAALTLVTTAFADAPNALVNNPDGVDGITLHIELDETDIPYATGWVPTWPTPSWPPEFDTIKAARFGTPAQRTGPLSAAILAAKKKAYRYCIFAHSYGSTGSSGLAEVIGDELLVTVPGLNAQDQATTLMHEYGHALGLRHGGLDDINHKPNYHSVMSYLWQFEILASTITVPESQAYYDSWSLDYSRSIFPTLNENSLKEADGIGADALHAGHMLAAGPPQPGADRFVPEIGPVDWNRDGDTTDVGVVADINRITWGDTASPGETLIGHEDWSKIHYAHYGNVQFTDGNHVEVPEEMNYTMLIRLALGDARADLDLDGDVDLADFDIFKACSTRAAVPYDPQDLPEDCTLTPNAQGKIAADLDGDEDVDQDDFGKFQRCYRGSGVLADPRCAD